MILAREPYTLVAMQPPSLARWIHLSRVAVGRLSGPIACECILICAYGYNRDHRDRGMNEGLLWDCLSYAAHLKMPAVFCGDLNDNPQSSQVLGRAEVLQMYRASPNSPTTLRHDKSVGKGLPIDHIYLNKAAASFAYRAWVDYTVPLSDHFPLRLSLWLPSVSSSFLVSKWSSPSQCIEMRKDAPPYPEGAVQDLRQWEKRAVTWLRSGSDTRVEWKGRIREEVWTPKQPSVDHGLTRLMSLMRLCREIEKFGLSSGKAGSLYRKVVVIARLHDLSGVLSMGMLQQRIGELIEGHLARVQEKGLKEWKEKVSSWRPTMKESFSYLRNEKATPNTAVILESSLVSHPIRLERVLCDYWRSIENTSCAEMDHAMEMLDDWYSMVIPHIPMWAVPDGRHVHRTVKTMRPSSHGWDGWAMCELKALPEVAWTQLMDLILVNPSAFSGTVSSWFKRVPLPKCPSSVNSVEQIRPIDVHSLVVRIVSASVCSLLSHWKRLVTHRSQYATQGGTPHACAVIAKTTELCKCGLLQRWSISLDFTKLFNMLAPQVGARIAEYAGLHRDTVKLLMIPALGSFGAWKLPLGASPTLFKNNRGLSQGLSGSVLLAELCLAPLLFRLSLAVPELECVAYVDDLNLMSSSLQGLVRTLQIVSDYVAHFALSLSLLKTVIWCSVPSDAVVLAGEFGCSTTDSIQALGAQWPVTHKLSEPCAFLKEAGRIDKCIMRLERLRVLPIHPIDKFALAATGCLSPLPILMRL